MHTRVFAETTMLWYCIPIHVLSCCVVCQTTEETMSAGCIFRISRVVYRSSNLRGLEVNWNCVSVSQILCAVQKIILGAWDSSGYLSFIFTWKLNLFSHEKSQAKNSSSVSRVSDVCGRVCVLYASFCQNSQCLNCFLWWEEVLVSIALKLVL